MNQLAPFEIDPLKAFPHLSAAPTVEAVIHWQARITRDWNAETIRQRLLDALPDFPKADLQHLHQFNVVAAPGMTVPPTVSKHHEWDGVRLQSRDGLHIAQFTRDGVTFSRLKPYENWDRFAEAARRAWKIFLGLGAPSEIQRLGVRFINRIAMPGFANLRDYLKEPPTFTGAFDLTGFFYQSMFDVPGHSLAINVVKTMQPTIPGRTNDAGLIIDVDVFTKKPLQCEDRVLDEYLGKMRWLKNKAFFELLTDAAIERLK